jgi:N-acetylneuraminic acid mutarotase
MWAYNALLNKWIQRASYPEGTIYYASCFAIGDTAYVGMGRSTQSPVSSTHFYAYNTLLDMWVQKADFPLAPKQATTCFAINGKGYVFGGADDYSSLQGVNNKLYEYNPQTNIWSVKTSLPDTGLVFGVAFVIKNKAYIVGGKAANYSFTNETWEYDPFLDKWTKKSNFAGGPRAHLTSFVLNNIGYVGGGVYGTDYDCNSDLWQYDAEKDIWSQQVDYPDGTIADCASFNLNGKGYITTGYSADHNQFNKISNHNWAFVPVVSAINTVKKNKIITISPNPNNGNFQLDCQLPANTSAILRIIDITGRIVAQYELDNNTNSININEAALNNGLYCCQVLVNGAAIWQGKMVVDK